MGGDEIVLGPCGCQVGVRVMMGARACLNALLLRFSQYMMLRMIG